MLPKCTNRAKRRFMEVRSSMNAKDEGLRNQLKKWLWINEGLQTQEQGNTVNELAFTESKSSVDLIEFILNWNKNIYILKETNSYLKKYGYHDLWIKSYTTYGKLNLSLYTREQDICNCSRVCIKIYPKVLLLMQRNVRGNRKLINYGYPLALKIIRK